MAGAMLTRGHAIGAKARIGAGITIKTQIWRALPERQVLSKALECRKCPNFLERTQLVQEQFAEYATETEWKLRRAVCDTPACRRRLRGFRKRSIEEDGVVEAITLLQLSEAPG